MKNLSFLTLFFLSIAFFACDNNTSTTETTKNPNSAVAKEDNSKKIVASTVGELSEKEIIPTHSAGKEVDLSKEDTKKAVKETAKEVLPEKTKVNKKDVTPVEKKQPEANEPKATTVAKRTTTPIKESLKKEKTTIKETPKEVKKEKKVVEVPAKPVFSHTAWDQMLRKNVSNSGKVNYKAFKSQKAALELYLKALSDNPIQSSWSRNKKMAYWINAYNAFTIKLIVDNYPVASITDLHGGKPWDKKWIKLGAKTYSLNNIENDILRPQFKDARIHFAVNCAAKSCPPILNRAWTESNLKSNFEKQAKAFINNASFNAISADKVEISKIFEWYAVDFGNIVDYLNKYAKTKINANATVSYKDYNWKLNE